MMINKTTSNYFYILLLCVIVIVNQSYAQTPYIIDNSSPYFCGFEVDDEDTQNWISVPINPSRNKWEVGAAEQFIGDQSLYVSYDNGITAGNNNTPNWISVYREFILPESVSALGSTVYYDISFDWKNPGYGDGRLYVLWVPDDVNITLSQMTNIEPGFIKSWAKASEGKKDTVMNASVSWQNKTFRVKGEGPNKVYRLIFLFQNSSESRHQSGKLYPAACIDNVQIGRSHLCLKPSNFKYTQIDDRRGKFTWDGFAEGPYEIKYKRTNSPDWTILDPVVGAEEKDIFVLERGSYVAAIRNICGNDTSIWSFFPNIFVYFSAENCLDYLDLEGSSVKTRIGNLNANGMTENRQEALVDYGFASKDSRHTIHYLDDEYDARTNYKLKTIPDDGLPSVRLGNWEIGAETETIEYSYEISGDAPLLLIKYAIVLEDPGHLKEQQPSFELEIFNGAGSKVDDMCGDVSFLADQNADGWEIGQIGGNEVVTFKRWSSVGLDLRDLIGQTITIRMTTKDCTETGHFGYAYFVLDCMSASVSGIGCGDSMFGNVSAPEGFKYKWYPKGYPEYKDLPGYEDTLQTFSPHGDLDHSGTFICEVISKENEDCIFEIEANLDPRDVYIDFTYDLIMENCQAEVVFENNSYTETRVYKDLGKPEYYEWDFGNGVTSNDISPTVYYEPGLYTVKLYASIADDLCYNEDSIQILIPDYGVTRDTTYAHRCTSDPDYPFLGQIFNQTDIYRFPYTSIYGCDSIIYLNLTVDDEYMYEWDDKTTTDEEYYFYGEKIDTTGTYTHFVEGMEGDCDSIFILNLTVDTLLRIQNIILPEICADMSSFIIEYEVKIGDLIEYSVIFGDKARQAGFADVLFQTHTNAEINIDIPSNIRPDYYDAQLIFYGSRHGNDTIELVLPVYYSSKILEQKWNDVIAVVNSEYNGGYKFSSYRWYVDWEEIEGKDGSYIYITSKLEFGKEYRALLTRTDDNVSIYTCAIIPEMRPESEIHLYPTIVPTGGAIRVSMEDKKEVEGTLWDAMGNKIAAYKLGNNSEFSAPAKKGIYLLKITNDNLETNTFKIIIN